MQIIKADLEETIDRVEKQSKKGFQTVMYMQGDINKPNNLIFLKNKQERKIFDRMNPENNRYASTDVTQLLDVLKTVQKSEKQSPELGFPEDFPKKFDLTGDLKEKQPKQEKTKSKRLHGDLDATEKQRIKLKVRR